MDATTDLSKRELKMYFLVMYNISPRQQGIQAGHCVEEYSDKYHDTELYKEYRKFKTWIVLNGGTSNDGVVLDDSSQEWWTVEINLGSMELYEKYLIENKIPYAYFHEPDLNYSLSSLCFICDNKVFDWVNYPTFEKWIQLNPSNDEVPLNMDEKYNQWVEFVGGEQNAKLKELIYGKKLA